MSIEICELNASHISRSQEYCTKLDISRGNALFYRGGSVVYQLDSRQQKSYAFVRPALRESTQ
jgi:hypothetical protein